MKQKAIILASLLFAASIAGCAAELYTDTEPPPLRVEIRPLQPTPEAIWIDGHWAWRAHQYVWIDGHWDRHPHGAWIPGRWDHRERGYFWTRGHWEHGSRHHH